jgi:hypothetical protein
MHPHSVRRVVAHAPPVTAAVAVAAVRAPVVVAAAVADVVDNGSAWT